MTLRDLGRALLLLLALDAPALAQRFPPGGATLGAEGLTYRFDSLFGVRSLSQVAIPVAVVWPRGRFVVDVGTHWATTRFERRDRTALTVSGFTDTQVRGGYVVGDDALVLTLLVNLPTGASSLTAAEYSVLAAASSSFLAFPVNAYGNGASVTGGAAVAFPAGEWNLGLAGSARISESFTPFRDAAGDFTYRAGFETRLRAGADRLVGPARLAFGLTYSTFSNDEFSTGAGIAGVYRPGTRLIGEASLTTLVGGTTVVGYAWDFLRLAGDSAGIGTGNRENVLAAGVMAHRTLTRGVVWEPRLEARFSQPEEGSAALAEIASAFRIRLARRLSLVPVARLDFGRLVDPDTGIGHSLRGYGLSVFLRGSF
jgi:hypothetical protein